MNVLSPQTGTAFHMKKGQRLRVMDPEGQQVADLFCFPADDLTDALSSGRSIDYNDTIRFSTASVLYASSGRKLMTIANDTCGVHDFLVTPCSLQMFRMMSGNPHLQHPSCLQNLAGSLAGFGVDPSRIGTTLNIFMNVPVHANGRISVETPLSKRGDCVELIAETDLIVGLTACSDEGTNAGRCKPIHFEIAPS
jgi:uncharacterized protein YcgI (DUF1989 family)